MHISNIQNRTLHFSNQSINVNWSTIPSFGMPTLSYDELVNEIEKIAKSIAMNKDENKNTYLNTKRNQLFAMFVSPVSPNRKQIYKDTINAIKRAKKEESIPCNKNLIDYLNEHDGFVEFDKKVNGYLSNGTHIESAYDCGTDDYCYNVSQGKKDIMSIGSRGNLYFNSC